MTGAGPLHVLTLSPAWRPFLDPLPMTGAWWWLTIIPLAFGVSVVYKAVRMRTLEGYWRNVLVMTAQIILGMVGLAVGVHLLLEFIVPALE